MKNFRKIIFDVIDSTQIYAKRLIKEKKISLKDKIVIVAKKQISGYGRFSRKWFSPEGGLWFSIVFSPKISLQKINQKLIPAITLSICDTAYYLLKINLYIKWPNDIIYKLNSKYKKLGGCIIETQIFKDFYFVIIGIGININNPIPKKIRNIAISFKDIIKKDIDTENLLDNFLIQFDKKIKMNSEILYKNYKKKSIVLGKKVLIKQHDKEIYGTVINIEKDNSILLKMNNRYKKILSGDLILLT